MRHPVLNWFNQHSLEETLPRDAFDASANSAAYSTAAYWRENYLPIDISSFTFEFWSFIKLIIISGDRGTVYAVHPTILYFLRYAHFLRGNLLPWISSYPQKNCLMKNNELSTL